MPSPLALLLPLVLAHAHGPAAGTAVLRVQGTSATLTVTLDPRRLDLDDDSDGRVDPDEVGRHRADLVERLDRAVALRDGADRAGTPGAADALLSGLREDPLVDGHPALRLVRQWTWDQAPPSLTMDWEGLGTDGPVALVVARVRTGPNGLPRRTTPHDLAELVLPTERARVAIGLDGDRALAAIGQAAPRSSPLPWLVAAMATFAIALTAALQTLRGRPTLLAVRSSAGRGHEARELL